jgi:hypothetical protein
VSSTPTPGSQWAPTHRIPEGGLPVWTAPDPSQPASARVDEGLDVRLLERYGDWAQVAFSNGWSGWVDGRAIRPISSAPAGAAAPIQPQWVATHTIPTGGLPAWAAPDPSRQPATTVEQGSEVRVVARRGDWARVAFSNGWSAWVDVRALVRKNAGPPGGVRSLQAAAIGGGGAGLAVLGTLLPWATIRGFSGSAWDLGFIPLITAKSGSSSLKTGLVVLLVAVAYLPHLGGKLPGRTASSPPRSWR